MDTPLLSPLLAQVEGLVHGFTLGEPSFPRVAPDGPVPSAVPAPEGWLGLLTQMGWPLATGLGWLRQVHGTHVQVIRSLPMGAPSSESFPPPLGDGDAILSLIPGVLLCIRVADCVPILVAGPPGVAMVIHSGWRGTAADIAGVAIRRLSEETGLRPGTLRAAIGPAIGPCCYEVGSDVVSAIGARVPPAAFLASSRNIDIRGAVAWQLREAGVGQVEVLADCTACTRSERGFRYHSHRRDGLLSGRQAGLIGWLE